MSEDQLRLYRTRLREATAAIEALRGKLAAEQGRREPLAIVGMGCRFPQADGPEAFWTALARGVDGVREIPGSRWPRDAIPGDRPEVRWAGLLDAVDGFDAAFFGVSPREAERLDRSSGCCSRWPGRRSRTRGRGRRSWRARRSGCSRGSTRWTTSTA